MAVDQQVRRAKECVRTDQQVRAVFWHVFDRFVGDECVEKIAQNLVDRNWSSRISVFAVKWGALLDDRRP